jgi:hypothetical protein
VKPVTFASLLLTVLALGVGAFAGRQQQQLRIRRSAKEPPASARPAVPVSTAHTASPQRGPPLSEAEHLELLRLRGQVQPLVRQLAELSGLSNQHGALQAQLDGYSSRATDLLQSWLEEPQGEALAQQLAAGITQEIPLPVKGRPGLRVMGRQEVSPDEVILTVGVAPGASLPLKFRREAQRWRLAP